MSSWCQEISESVRETTDAMSAYTELYVAQSTSGQSYGELKAHLARGSEIRDSHP